jgi:hypothetical protein
MTAVAAALLVSPSALAQRDAKSSQKAERISGVITKVEEAGSGKARRVTINTAAVWRDWVRDQASVKPTGSVEKAAEKGKQSIATKGEPKSPDTLIVVEVGSDAKIEQRYRSSTDERSSGAATTEGAAQAEKDQGKTSGASKAQGKSVEPSALKPGLWVDVECRHTSSDKNQATKVYVLRPVGGPDTPAGQTK